MKTLTNVACDFCYEKPEEITDGQTKSGQWGYMCDDCLKAHGKGIANRYHNVDRTPRAFSIDDFI